MILKAPSKIRINKVNVVTTGAKEARSSGDVNPYPFGPIRKPMIIRNITSGIFVRRNNVSEINPKIAIKLIDNNAIFTFIFRFLFYFIVPTRALTMTVSVQ